MEFEKEISFCCPWFELVVVLKGFWLADKAEGEEDEEDEFTSTGKGEIEGSVDSLGEKGETGDVGSIGIRGKRVVILLTFFLPTG